MPLLFPERRSKEDYHRIEFKTAGKHYKAVPPFYADREPAIVARGTKLSESRTYVSNHAQGTCKRSEYIHFSKATDKGCNENQAQIDKEERNDGITQILFDRLFVEPQSEYPMRMEHAEDFVFGNLIQNNPAYDLYASGS